MPRGGGGGWGGVGTSTVAGLLGLLAGDGGEDGGAGARLFRHAAALGDRHELTVIDGGSRLEGVAGACAVGVERLLAVTTADLIGVTALYALVKAVDGAFPGTPVEVVVNGQEEDAARRVFEQVRAGTARFRGRGVRFAGTLPEDACLRAGVGGGMTLYDAAVGSAIARKIEEIAARILFELRTHLPAVTEPRHLQWRV